MGNDTRDAYARLLERMAAFKREFSIEHIMYGTSEGMGVDELIGKDDVTILESKGLENTFKNFIFGGCYVDSQCSLLWRKEIFVTKNTLGTDNSLSTKRTVCHQFLRPECNEVVITIKGTGGNGVVENFIRPILIPDPAIVSIMGQVVLSGFFNLFCSRVMVKFVFHRNTPFF
jgi:hypothetical protein